MYVPQKEKPLGPAALKANFQYWMKEHEKHLSAASNAMEEARKCIDLLAAHDKGVD